MSIKIVVDDPTMNSKVFSDDLLEKYSSAISLSDIEIFIFPELLLSLVLANIMSPVLWGWKQDPWFKNIERMKPSKKISRLRQYIIDNYEFNLDLETWGTTKKSTELNRFRNWLDEKAISESNALFGYQGDRYYFDLDMRRHFGLDAYTDDVIPYWKTETIEAMNAFRSKAGYTKAAGECVSFSALYAAALFVVCGIPLRKIFLIATPLHSQNYVNINNGLITNNRRVVTKNMWFNGTEQSFKARRALQNEQITIVANSTGYIHYLHDTATISPELYKGFSKSIGDFLSHEIDENLAINFLRHFSSLQHHFQLVCNRHDKLLFLPLEKAFAYESKAPVRLTGKKDCRLLEEIDDDEFFHSSFVERITISDFVLHATATNHAESTKNNIIEQEFASILPLHQLTTELINFSRIHPKLPSIGREMKFLSGKEIEIEPEMTRDEVTNYLLSIRSESIEADLSFYTSRDIRNSAWLPFLKTAIERNPASILATEKQNTLEIIKEISSWKSNSIYEGNRLAQPDEVWNFKQGDGIEKAILVANIMLARSSQMLVSIKASGNRVSLTADVYNTHFKNKKRFHCSIQLAKDK